MSHQLIHFNKAKHELELARTIDEAKDISDKAEALRVYAKQSGESLEMQNKCAEIGLRADRKIGEFSKKLPKSTGNQHATSHRGEKQKSNILKDAGIKHYERYEALADIPVADFEKHIIDTVDNNKELTKHDTLKKFRKEKRKERIRENERDSLNKVGDERLWNVTNTQEVIQCDVLITDPPYGILDLEWEPGNNSIEDVTRLWATKWAYCGADIILTFFSQRYLFEGREWFDESFLGYTFQQLLIWHYPNNKSPQSRMGFKQTWEPVFFYRKNGSEKKIGIHSSEWGKDCHDFDCHVAAVPQSNFNDVNCKQHPAQKPLSVMKWLINAVSVPGELICDPFMGSGTTGIAATQLGRKFIGIESDGEYIKIAKGRLAAYGK